MRLYSIQTTPRMSAPKTKTNSNNNKGRVHQRKLSTVHHHRKQPQQCLRARGTRAPWKTLARRANVQKCLKETKTAVLPVSVEQFMKTHDNNFHKSKSQTLTLATKTVLLVEEFAGATATATAAAQAVGVSDKKHDCDRKEIQIDIRVEFGCLLNHGWFKHQKEMGLQDARLYVKMAMRQIEVSAWPWQPSKGKWLVNDPDHPAMRLVLYKKVGCDNAYGVATYFATA